MVDLARETEESGWDGFFVWDHLVSGGRSPVTDPWAVLAAVAVTTSRIRFGPMITPLARRRPWKVAREAVALDQLSDGRFVLGVGLGHFSDKEFGAFGDEANPKIRGELLDESLEILAGLWSGEPFAFEGKHYQIKKNTFRPSPVQTPRIPIWVGGGWPNKRPMRRAAAWDGVFPMSAGSKLSSMMSPVSTAEVIAYVGQQRTESTPFDYIHTGQLTGDPAADAIVVQTYADVGVTWWLEQVYSSRMTLPKLRAFIRQGPPTLG